MQKNEYGHYRGLHVAFINPKTGKVVLGQIFDTYKSSFAFDKFIDTEIPKGTIVLATCMDECAKNLSDKARKWFSDMGSIEIDNLKYR